MLSFTLLGRTELSNNGETLCSLRSQKETALLVYLAHTGQAHRRDTMAELLWDSDSTKQALSNLRTVLTRLQQQVNDALLITNRSIELAPHSRQHVDSVILLRTLLSHSQIRSADSAIALEKALASYHGDFLANFHLRNASCFDEWALATREHIHHQVTAAYHKLGQYLHSVGELERGIAIVRRWLHVDTLDEVAHTLLIRMLIEAGHVCDAVIHYEHCVELLRTELAVEPPAAMTALIKDFQPKRITLSRQVVTARHNLPASHDQFFGRSAIQHGIHMRLDQSWCRLVTIIGPGGVGKTRLATMVAQDRLSYYPDGVWLVELAEVDPDDENLTEAIAVEIASVVDLRFSGSATPAKQLIDYLQHKQALLILDNFEHLLEGNQLILDIMRRCEQVQMLVTSREALQLRGEWMITLAGLSFPGSEADEAPTEAVELFMARRAQHHLDALSDDDLAAVRSICCMVEGLPLAIELAAALTRHAAPRAIAHSLRDSFDMLTTSLRDVPRRHHSLQIVFEMSWRTLSPALQQRLSRLSVFRAGFTAAAAQQVAEANPQQLTALCEKSLLSYHLDSNRYTLHPVISAYADAKRLPDDQTPQQHAHYYLTLLAQHSEALQTHSPQDVITALEPDIDNLRLAWQIGLVQGHADWLLPALSSLSIYYQLRGLALEGETVMHATFDAAVAWEAAGVALATHAGIERARFQNRLGQHWPAMHTVQATLKLATANADRWAEGMAHVLWGEALWRLGKYEVARSNLTQAMAIAQSIQSTQLIGWCHHHLGVIDDIQGSYAAAYDHLLQACNAWRRLDNTTSLSLSLNSIGLICYHQGNLAAAQEYMQQSLTLCEHVDNRHLQAPLLNNLSMIATEQGDYTGAQDFLQLGLELAISSANLTVQAETYNNQGRNYHLLGEMNLAIEALEQGLRIAEMLGNRSLMSTTMLNLAEVKSEHGDVQRAESLYNQALHIAQQDNLQRTECEILLGLIRLLRNTNPHQARQYSSESVALAQAIGNIELIEQAAALARTLPVSLAMSARNLSA